MKLNLNMKYESYLEGKEREHMKAVEEAKKYSAKKQLDELSRRNDNENLRLIKSLREATTEISMLKGSLKEKEERERIEEIRKEQEKQRLIEEERAKLLREKDEEEERIKEENRRIKEWEDKFDQEQKLKEEELIKKFYNDQNSDESENVINKK